MTAPYMKGTLYTISLLAIVLGGLLSVLLINTAQFTSMQQPAQAVTTIALDEQAAARRLGGALRYATVSQPGATADDFPAMLAFQDYLQAQFPRAHNTLQRERLGELSLLYTWHGRDETLAPLLLLAHQDVVPVQPGSEDDWEYPPFSGEVTESHIWGRGAIDNKNGVLASLEAVELMLSRGEEPQRTVMLAFGHDEEIGGTEGARVLAHHLSRQNLKPWMIIDEGGIVLNEHGMPIERPLALVGVAEKGYLNLALTVTSPGGHSAHPPRETAVTILAGAIQRLAEAPFPARLDGVTEQMFRYLGPEMSPVPRLMFANTWLFEPLLIKQMSADPATDALLRTTMAATMLEGSPKENVLPSRARAVINLRIAPGRTLDGVTARVVAVVNDDRVTVEPTGNASSPSAVSPVDGEPFATLQRTIQHVFPDAVVSPFLVLGATDSRHYSDLSPYIYRFTPLAQDQDDIGRMHGPNERVSITAYADSIRFYRRLIRNADGEN